MRALAAVGQAHDGAALLLVHGRVERVVPRRAERALVAAAAVVAALEDERDRAGQLEVDGVGEELAADHVDRVPGEEADDEAQDLARA